MIVKHFYVTWNILSLPVKRKIFFKAFIFLFFFFFPLFFRNAITQTIFDQINKYGYCMVSFGCLLLASLFLFGYRFEYSRLKADFFPDMHFSFYQCIGFTKRQFHYIRLIYSFPYFGICLVYSCAVVFPLLEIVIEKAAFFLIYCVLLFSVSIELKRKKKALISSYYPWRNNLLKKNRLCAAVIFSTASGSVCVFWFFSLILSCACIYITKSFGITLFIISWFSSYFTTVSVNSHYQNRNFYQILPQTYIKLIRDDMLVSCVMYATLYVILVCLSFLFSCSFDKWLIITLLSLFSTYSNHFFLYCWLDLQLPKNNPINDSAHIITGLVFLFLIPCVSVLILVPFYFHKRNQLYEPIYWGER